MNSSVPAYLFPYLFIGTFATVAAITFGVGKALRLAGWRTQDRRLAVWKVAALLGLWSVTALLLSWFGFYRTISSRVPTIQFGLLIPIVAALIWFWRSPTLRRIVEDVPQEWLVSVQLYRVEGLIFLLLYAAGRLPGVFALPAGIGDVLVGLFAPLAGLAYARSPQRAAERVRAWNLAGIADLTVAVTMGFLSSPSQFQIFSLGAPNELISSFPLVIVPVFLVPLSILLHLASLYKLRHSSTERLVRGPLLAGQRS